MHDQPIMCISERTLSNNRPKWTQLVEFVESKYDNAKKTEETKRESLAAGITGQFTMIINGEEWQDLNRYYCQITSMLSVISVLLARC